MHHGVFGTFTCNDMRIAMVHYPEQVRELASLSTYDIICCGHSHRHGIEYFGETLLINPGQLLGEEEEAGFSVPDLAERRHNAPASENACSTRRFPRIRSRNLLR